MAERRGADGSSAADRVRARRLRKALSVAAETAEADADADAETEASPARPPPKAGDRPPQESRELDPYAAPAIEEAPRPHVGRSPGPLAGRASRLLARIFDGVVLVPAVLLAYVAGAASGERSAMPIVAVIGLLAAAVYQAWLISTTGQSIGKRLLGIKIIRVDGLPLGFVHGVLLREIVPVIASLVPGIGPLLSLADSLAIFGGRRLCLHDRIAGTEVVNAR